MQSLRYDWILVVYLYQVSIKGKEKDNRIETHSTKNALVKVNIEVNNALVENAPPVPIEAKSLEVLDLFDNPDGKWKSHDW